MEYPEPVQRRFEQPTRSGMLEGFAGFCVAGGAGREDEGLRIWLAARVVGGRIDEARFRAYGCPQAIAVADWAAEQIEGKDLARLRIDPLAASEQLKMWPEKLNCALCAEDAVKALRANWQAILQSNESDPGNSSRGTS